MLAAVDVRCREALDADVAMWRADGRMRYEETRFAVLIDEAEPADLGAIALWVHQRQLAHDRARRTDEAGGVLDSAAHVLAQRHRVSWPADVLLRAGERLRSEVAVRPWPYFRRLDLLVAVAEESTRQRGPDPSATAVALWRWFAGRTDVLYSGNDVTRMRIRLERLLPAPPDDPFRVLADDCPLAHRLRRELAPSLRRRDVADALRRYGDPPDAPGDIPSWRAASVDPVPYADVLRNIGEIASAHRSSVCRVVRRGRSVRRMTWAEPPTLLLLEGVLEVLADVPEPWVDDVLADLATTTMLVHPARRGRYPLLLRYAASALRRRRTEAAKAHLRRLEDDPDRYYVLRGICHCPDRRTCRHSRY